MCPVYTLSERNTQTLHYLCNTLLACSGVHPFSPLLAPYTLHLMLEISVRSSSAVVMVSSRGCSKETERCCQESAVTSNIITLSRSAANINQNIYCMQAKVGWEQRFESYPETAYHNSCKSFEESLLLYSDKSIQYICINGWSLLGLKKKIEIRQKSHTFMYRESIHLICFSYIHRVKLFKKKNT